MRKKVLNIEVDDISKDQLLQELREGFLVTPNMDHLYILSKDSNFLEIYKKAEWVICDSKIIRLFTKIFAKKSIRNVIAGSDLLPLFYDFHRDNSAVSIYLLGGMGDSAKLAAKKINSNLGREIVVGYNSPSYGFEKDKAECESLIDKINESKANVLVVGVGAPKQEKWAWKYKDRLNTALIMNLGATIDFEAGIVTRSPRFFSYLGMEWLFRFFREPKRMFKRYFIHDIQVIGYFVQDWYKRF